MKEQYLNEVSRLLPRKLRKQVVRDLEERFQAAEEHGASVEEVISHLGTPAEFAAAFREERRPSLIPPLFLAAAGLLAAVWSGAALFLQWQLECTTLGVIGGVDGPTEVFISKSGPSPFLFLLPISLVVLVIGILWLRKRRK